MTREEQKIVLNKKYGTPMCIATLAAVVIWFVFPKQLMANVYVLLGFLVVCVPFLAVYFREKWRLAKVNNTPWEFKDVLPFIVYAVLFLAFLVVPLF